MKNKTQTTQTWFKTIEGGWETNNSYRKINFISYSLNLRALCLFIKLIKYKFKVCHAHKLAHVLGSYSLTLEKYILNRKIWVNPNNIKSYKNNHHA